jgi:hypothetical protein
MANPVEITGFFGSAYAGSRQYSARLETNDPFKCISVKEQQQQQHEKFVIDPFGTWHLVLASHAPIQTVPLHNGVVIDSRPGFLQTILPLSLP